MTSSYLGICLMSKRVTIMLKFVYSFIYKSSQETLILALQEYFNYCFSETLGLLLIINVTDDLAVVIIVPN